MYKLGQKVCLWQTKIVPGSNQITVIKEVIVEIAGIKTEVPSAHSRSPVNLQSLRGIGEDGKIYEKHWDVWPESQMRDYVECWSARDDATIDTGNRHWIPVEAVYVYDARQQSRRYRKAVRIVDGNEDDIKPKGDVVYCERHDQYDHVGNSCVFCLKNLPAVS